VKYPQWQTPCQEALLETEKEKLREKVLLVEWKVFESLQQISFESTHHEERRTIANGLNALLELKHEKLRYPECWF
jgi:hypothetical protein